MSATLTLRKKKYEVKAGMTLRDALIKLEISPESVIPVKNDELITDDLILEEGDKIKLIAAISGG
jgi:sulfur carrier protein ThiS